MRINRFWVGIAILLVVGLAIGGWQFVLTFIVGYALISGILYLVRR